MIFSMATFVKTLFADTTSNIDRAAVETAPSRLCAADRAVEAIVTQTIAPGRKGQVKYQGSWWTARCNGEITFVAGDIVHVISRQNLTLYIEPAAKLMTLCKL